MSIASNLVPIVVVLVVVAACAAAVKAKLSGQSGAADARFKAKALLTANELEFLSRLEAAAPELRFHAQVSMGALIEPAVSRKDAKAYYRMRGMFSQKIVDFVAQRRSDGAVVAVIELDDRTHDDAKDSKRDSMLSSAGLRVIRWSSKAKPNLDAIRAQLAPPAPAAAAGDAQALPADALGRTAPAPTRRPTA